MSEHLFTCVSTIVEHGGKFLMVAEAERNGPSKFDLPSGTLNQDEELLQAAARITSEITGLSVGGAILQAVYHQVRAAEMNYVFAVPDFGGAVRTTGRYPIVEYYSLPEITAMADVGQLHVPCIPRMLCDYREGRRIGNSAIRSI